MNDDLDQMGPIDYIVVEFPGSKMTGEGLPLLVDLVDRGIIRILDLAFVTKDLDGTVRGIAISDFDGDGELDLAAFEGASSGLLGEDDIEEAGTVLEAGSSAGILVYENVWAGPFASAVRRGGGQLVASGRIPIQAMLAALEAADAADAASDTRDREVQPMPGLLRGVARTAVIAGTATHVSNNVSRRQANRWAAKEQQQAPQQYEEPPQQYAAPPPPPAPASTWTPSWPSSRSSAR